MLSAHVSAPVEHSDTHVLGGGGGFLGRKSSLKGKAENYSVCIIRSFQVEWCGRTIGSV